MVRTVPPGCLNGASRHGSGDRPVVIRFSEDAWRQSHEPLFRCRPIPVQHLRALHLQAVQVTDEDRGRLASGACRQAAQHPSAIDVRQAADSNEHGTSFRSEVLPDHLRVLKLDLFPETR